MIGEWPVPSPQQPIIKDYVHEAHAVRPGKKVNLLLMWTVFPPHCYIVKSITNSTWYKIGDRLDELVVKQIIDQQPDWEVSVVGDDIITAITNSVGAATAIKAVPGLV